MYTIAVSPFLRQNVHILHAPSRGEFDELGTTLYLGDMGLALNGIFLGLGAKGTGLRELDRAGVEHLLTGLLSSNPLFSAGNSS